MSLEPADLSITFGELSLDSKEDNTKTTNRQENTKAKLKVKVLSKDKRSSRPSEVNLKHDFIKDKKTKESESKYRLSEKRLKQGPFEKHDVKPTSFGNDKPKVSGGISDTKKSTSTLRNSNFSSLNNSKPHGNLVGSKKVVTTFKSNIYASLGTHKKVTTPSAEKIIIPNNNGTSREDIKVHDRWAKYSKTKDSSLVVANSKNKELEVFDARYDDERASKSLLINLASKDENNFEEEEVKPEDYFVKGLEVPLLPHQVSGLRFLKKREALSGAFKGGLLCDDMGLGKTIQTIALILENKNTYEAKYKTNLIICPVSLTNQWKSEIESKAPTIKVIIFHGTSRPKNYETLAEYDVVITTYATISSEFSKNESQSVLYSPEFKWWRIVLDEAHQIKNKKSKQAEAVFNLDTDCRWCLTGTPLQNNLGELQSLFKFIRVSKYADDREWADSIQKSLQEKNIYSALVDLREELSKLMLRRTKKILSSGHNTFKLPPKNMHRISVEFSEFERSIYDNVKDIVLSKLNTHPINKELSEERTKFIKPDAPVLQLKKQITGNKNGNVNYMSALVYLLRLRQLCCSWSLLFYEKTDSLDFEDELTTSSDKDISVDNLINSMDSLSVDARNCEVCMIRLDITNTSGDNNRFCKDCGENVKPTTKDEDEYHMSSKIKQVLEILSSNRERKTIIFSQFPSLFGLLGKVLKSRGLEILTYDGSMDINTRSLALNSLKSDPNMNILLCSLKCGSVGLNLTCASQVILFDPWWNPQLQEQAIDRVYRIGQTQTVDIYELTVRDTVEDNILKLQETKRQLANTVMSGNKLSATNISSSLTKNELLQLFGIEKR